MKEVGFLPNGASRPLLSSVPASFDRDAVQVVVDQYNDPPSTTGETEGCYVLVEREVWFWEVSHGQS